MLLLLLEWMCVRETHGGAELTEKNTSTIYRKNPEYAKFREIYQILQPKICSIFAIRMLRFQSHQTAAIINRSREMVSIRVYAEC